MINIYMLNDAAKKYNFWSLEEFQNVGISPNISMYRKVWEREIPIGESIGEMLEEIFYILNCEHPRDYRNRSLSVSDVVVCDGEAYFVDSFGFKKLLNFWKGGEAIGES